MQGSVVIWPIILVILIGVLFLAIWNGSWTTALIVSAPLVVIFLGLYTRRKRRRSRL